MSLIDLLAEFKEKEGESDILKANWYTIAVRKEDSGNRCQD